MIDSFPKKYKVNDCNLLYPDISMCFLLTALCAFDMVLIKRIFLTIMSFFSLWLFPSFSWPKYVIQGWYCKEKLDASHFLGSKS